METENETITYPVSKETLHNYASLIFSPLKRNESVSTVWPPMAGRRTINKFIIKNIHLFKNELRDYDKYLLVYVEPMDLTEHSKSGYIRLVGRSFLEVCKANDCSAHINHNEIMEVFNDESASYPNLLDTLRDLLLTVSQHGREIVFFLGEFDELTFVSPLMFGNLKSLWDKVRPNLHYVFLLRSRVTRNENIKLWGEELSEVILQNIIYVPILEKDDIEHMLKRLSNEFGTDFSSDQKKIMVSLCGGHPYMLKVAARLMSRYLSDKDGKNLEKELSQHYELRSVAKRIINHSADSEREVLIKIALGKILYSQSEKQVIDFLVNLGLVKRLKSGKYELFSKIFKDAIVRYENRNKTMIGEAAGFQIDESSGAVYIDDKNIDGEFTRQELGVLIGLIKSDKVLTRDEISKILWGSEAEEKYSDWAIDQLISKLRKKMKTLGVDMQVITVRGKGYKLELSSKHEK